MEAPKIPSFFGVRTKKPSQFYFEPRYYDKRKEKIKKRYDRISKELENSVDDELSVAEFKSKIREDWGSSYSRTRAGGQMNRRVIIYVIILLALAYYILFSGF